MGQEVIGGAWGFGAAACGCTVLLIDKGWERRARVGFLVLAVLFGTVTLLEVLL